MAIATILFADAMLVLACLSLIVNGATTVMLWRRWKRTRQPTALMVAPPTDKEDLA